MILFDNGPPDGDYARYIDALMAERAASLVAATMTPDDDVVDRKRPADGRRNPMTSPAFKPSDERLRDALRDGKTVADTNTGARVPAAPHGSARVSADASQRAAGLSPTAASAIASAMMTRGDDGRPAALASASAGAGAIAIVAGVAMILIGILGSTTNVLLIVAGIALVSWALKRLGKGVAPRIEATVADRFAGASMRRTAPRGKRED